MRRRSWIIALAVLTTLIVGATVAFNIVYRSRTVSSAVSPDGSWSVAVIGHRRLNGAYELVVEVRDREGRLVPTGAFVVGLTHDLLLAAEQNFPVSFVDADTVQVGKRTLEKSSYFK